MAREQGTPQGITLQDQLIAPELRKVVETPFLQPRYVLLYLLHRFDHISQVELEQFADGVYEGAQADTVTPLLQVVAKTDILERRKGELTRDNRAYSMYGSELEERLRRRGIRQFDEDPVLNLVALQRQKDEMEFKRPTQIPRKLTDSVIQDPNPILGEGPIRPFMQDLQFLKAVGLATARNRYDRSKVTHYPTPLGVMHAEATLSTFVHIDWKDYQNPLVVVKSSGTELYDRPLPQRRRFWQRK